MHIISILFRSSDEITYKVSVSLLFLFMFMNIFGWKFHLLTNTRCLRDVPNLICTQNLAFELLLIKQSVDQGLKWRNTIEKREGAKIDPSFVDQNWLFIGDKSTNLQVRRQIPQLQEANGSLLGAHLAIFLEFYSKNNAF